MKIYVASSWKNNYQPTVVKALQLAGHEVYDFRNPTKENHGFHWSQAGLTREDALWGCSADVMTRALNHPVATQGYQLDYQAMMWADVCVLVLPSGRRAHLEAGYMAGQGKRVVILCLAGDLCEPELMYLLMTKKIYSTIDEIVNILAS